MKGMWVGYGVVCTMRLTLGHGAWQIDQTSNGSMWNSYSFQPVGQWMGYSFTDLGAEGCCRSLNALLSIGLTVRYLFRRFGKCLILSLAGISFFLCILSMSFLWHWINSNIPPDSAFQGAQVSAKYVAQTDVYFSLLRICTFFKFVELRSKTVIVWIRSYFFVEFFGKWF